MLAKLAKLPSWWILHPLRFHAKRLLIPEACASILQKFLYWLLQFYLKSTRRTLINFKEKFFFRAIAASAPVAQFDAPCDAFGRIVTADYTAQGAFCSQTIRRSWEAIDNVTSTGKELATSF